MKVLPETVPPLAPSTAPRRRRAGVTASDGGQLRKLPPRHRAAALTANISVER